MARVGWPGWFLRPVPTRLVFEELPGWPEFRAELMWRQQRFAAGQQVWPRFLRLERVVGSVPVENLAEPELLPQLFQPVLQPLKTWAWPLPLPECQEPSDFRLDSE